MLSLKQINNLKKESFFKEAKELFLRTKRIKPNKLKNFLFKSAIIAPLTIIFTTVLLRCDWDTDIPITMELPFSALIFIAFTVLIGSVCIGLASNFCINTFISNKNEGKYLSNILKYVDLKTNKIYDKKDIKDFELALINSSKETKYILDNYYDFNYENEKDYEENFKRKLIIRFMHSLSFSELNIEKEKIIEMVKDIGEENKLIIYREIEESLIEEKDKDKETESDKVLSNIKKLNKERKTRKINSKNVFIKDI
jgi:hypothetical protein